MAELNEKEKTLKAENEEEWQEILKFLKNDRRASKLMVARAIKLALEFKEKKLPFTYIDVELPENNRRQRRQLKNWALLNGFEIKRATIALSGGSQDAFFYPSEIDQDTEIIFDEDREE
jgi:hypothetical protein